MSSLGSLLIVLQSQILDTLAAEVPSVSWGSFAYVGTADHSHVVRVEHFPQGLMQTFLRTL